MNALDDAVDVCLLAGNKEEAITASIFAGKKGSCGSADVKLCFISVLVSFLLSVAYCVVRGQENGAVCMAGLSRCNAGAGSMAHLDGKWTGDWQRQISLYGQWNVFFCCLFFLAAGRAGMVDRCRAPLHFWRLPRGSDANLSIYL